MARSRARSTRQDSSVEDLLVPAIPSMISSLVLSGLSSLSGVAKIGMGGALGLLLWLLLQRRRGRPLHVPGGLRRHWLAGLLLLVGAAVVVLLVTVVVMGLPTAATTVTSVAVLVALSASAVAGGRPQGAGAAAVSGGVLGLCLGILLG
jgi:hypothetical protein